MASKRFAVIVNGKQNYGLRAANEVEAQLAMLRRAKRVGMIVNKIQALELQDLPEVKKKKEIS